MEYSAITKVYEVEEIMEYNKWMKEIPFIKFKSDWEVKITPPFAGAVARFRVRKNGVEISIYLDCYDKLGCFGEPYWGIYPHGEDVFRCKMNDTEALLKAIEESLSQ